MLLEMLMGADKKEIAGDYMASFLGRPGFEKVSSHYKREQGYFIAVLKKLNGGESVKNNAMPKIAEKYFLKQKTMKIFWMKLKKRMRNKYFEILKSLIQTLCS